MNAPPRLKDVAEAAGVSTMSVSLALRNHTSIPLGTRERIHKIARQLDYRPDPKIAKLMEQVRGKKRSASRIALAYVTAHASRDGWKHSPTQRDYHVGAMQHADKLGYRLEHFWLGEPGMTELRLSNIIRNRGIDGVIIAPLAEPGSPFTRFDWRHFSVVGLGYSVREPVLHRCCNQQFNSMLLLLGQLRKAGYSRIGLAMGPGQDERTNHNWRAAYLTDQSLVASGPLPAIPMLHGMETNWSRDHLAAWIGEFAPDLIVTVGVDVQNWLRDLGLKTPRDIGLANVDINETMPAVTGINQNALQIGAAAIDLLISLMRNGERGLPAVPRTLMVDGYLVQGETTRVRPRKRR